MCNCCRTAAMKMCLLLVAYSDSVLAPLELVKARRDLRSSRQTSTPRRLTNTHTTPTPTTLLCSNPWPLLLLPSPTMAAIPPVHMTAHLAASHNRLQCPWVYAHLTPLQPHTRSHNTSTNTSAHNTPLQQPMVPSLAT